MTSRLGLGLVLACLAVLALPALALGHDELVGSDPADGATLPTTPYTLTATFDEELAAAGSSILVQNSAGTIFAAGTVSTADDKVMTAELPHLPPGEYVVRWTAVTVDDQAVEHGSFTFAIADASTAQPSIPEVVPGDTGGDTLVAIVLAAAAIGAILMFIYYRGRR